MADKDIKPNAVTLVDVIQVIRTVAMRGAGTPEDPFRNVTQFWTMDGLLIKDTDIQMEANEIARKYGQHSDLSIRLGRACEDSLKGIRGKVNI